MHRRCHGRATCVQTGTRSDKQPVPHRQQMVRGKSDRSTDLLIGGVRRWPWGEEKVVLGGQEERLPLYRTRLDTMLPVHTLPHMSHISYVPHMRWTGSVLLDGGVIARLGQYASASPSSATHMSHIFYVPHIYTSGAYLLEGGAIDELVNMQPDSEFDIR